MVGNSIFVLSLIVANYFQFNQGQKTLFHVKKKLITFEWPKRFFQTILWSKRQFSMWLCIGILSSGSKSIPTTILGMSRIKLNKAYQTGTEMKKKKMWKWLSKGLFWKVYPCIYIIGTQQLGPVHCLRSFIYPKHGAGVGLYQPEWADRNRVKVQNLIFSFFGRGCPGLSLGLGPGVSFVFVLS